MFFNYEIYDDGREIIFDLYYGTNPDPAVQIMHKILTEKVGHVDFTADNDGVFSYCLSQNSGDLPTRTKMLINYGFDSEHYEKLIKEHNFDAINLQVHKLNDLLTMTLNEADFQKHKEVDYHDETERMNNAALWWPVVQVRNFNSFSVYFIFYDCMLTDLYFGFNWNLFSTSFKEFL
jgi:hypothetical protein